VLSEWGFSTDDVARLLAAGAVTEGSPGR
jgi:hypothetical protein